MGCVPEIHSGNMSDDDYDHAGGGDDGTEKAIRAHLKAVNIQNGTRPVSSCSNNRCSTIESLIADGNTSGEETATTATVQVQLEITATIE